ncbi:restriction endonuclease subunit S [Nonlabens xiamenensis]|uniref:restriction endonuclease subunit S n=1 Tax=Nonlabens xiamenensis TaxID=2341043 RepID=UPI000F6125DC|nr:restriction endonuclease subunit S [Nonlabens xiamenensis]
MKDNWKDYFLTDIADFHNGMAFKPIHWKKEGVPIIRIEQITRPETANWDFYQGNFAKKNEINTGDVIFSWSATLKVVVWKGGKAVLNQHLFKVDEKKGFDRYYVAYLIDFNLSKLADESQGSTMKHVTRKSLEKFKVNLPPLPQQKKIAQILSTVDEVIEQTETAIAKYEAIKQGLMHDLFTRGIDIYTGKLRPSPQDAPELYKESALGLIPREWELETLENITSYVDYRGKTPPKSDKGIFLVTAKNIKFGYIDYEISKEYILHSSYKATMSRGIPEKGDVLITTEAPLGNIAQIDIEGLALAQRVIKYRCLENEMLNDFLKHSMMSEYFQKELEAESTGSTVKGIKGSRLHQLQVLKPQIDEQNRIIQTIKPIESKIQTEQQTLGKYQQLKAGLMQDLLTGRVGVVVDEED